MKRKYNASHQKKSELIAKKKGAILQVIEKLMVKKLGTNIFQKVKINCSYLPKGKKREGAVMQLILKLNKRREKTVIIY